jgi:integrase
MPTLTTAAVLKLCATTARREIADSKAVGLYLIVQPKPSGHKSWALRFRRPDGRGAKLTLGSVELTNTESADEPVFGGPLTLRQARALAAQIDRQRARGVDVVEHYKADRQRKAAAIRKAAANTFGAAVREFVKDYKTKWGRPRRWQEDARLLGLAYPAGVSDPAEVEPQIIPGSLAATWADKPISSIDGHDIHTVVDEARKHGIPGLGRHNSGISESRGRKVHAALSVLFAWLVRDRKLTVNPCVGVWRPAAPPDRERVLNDAEIAKFWKATDQVGQPFGPALKLLLLTGCRLNEVAEMRRGELSDDGVWSLPGARTKNHRPHTLALPPLAQEIITAVPRIAGSDLIFTTNGTTAVTSWPGIKRQLDAVMAAPDWRLHDLRRTAATGMAEIGVQPHIIEAVLNHISGHKGGVAGIYNRAQYAPEKKAALARWADHLQGLVAGTKGKVVALRGKS